MWSVFVNRVKFFSVLKKKCFPNSSFEHCQYYCHAHGTSNGIRVRFAPSPTGMLHLGGLRMVLFNYAFARSRNGKFILRIEDTDQTRIVPRAAEKLIEMLKWLGINPDEGPGFGGEHGPYAQSQRLDLYQQQIKILLEKGCAYRCFCTPRRLELIRKEAIRQGETPGYDNHCRHLQTAEVEARLRDKLPYVVRFKVPCNAESFQDLVYGSTVLNLSEQEGDPILIKSDGFPTYHFANVVDDHFMKITHVLRGVEWHISTVKHILLYKAFGYRPPEFAHLPLLLNANGTKLSKRQGNISVEDFKNKGYHPEAILNFVASIGMGFAPPSNKILALDELVHTFSLEKVSTHSSKVDLHLLDLFNRRYIQQSLNSMEGIGHLVQQLREIVLQQFKCRLGHSDLQQKILGDKYVARILRWSESRIHRLQELVEKDLEYLWVIPETIDQDRLPYKEKQAESIAVLLQNHLNDLSDECFSREKLNTALKEFAKEHGLQYKILMKFLRGIVCNTKEGPGMAEIFEILGKEATLDRLRHAGVTLRDCNENISHLSMT